MYPVTYLLGVTSNAGFFTTIHSGIIVFPLIFASSSLPRSSEKETCYILQGKAQVFDDNGAILVEFGKGDLVVFPPGLRCKWKILENMRKHYNLG